MDLIPVKKQKSISSSHRSDSSKNEGIKPHFGSDSVYPKKMVHYLLLIEINLAADICGTWLLKSLIHPANDLSDYKMTL